MERYDPYAIHNYLERVLSNVEGRLDDESATFVKDYISVGEYGIAFEGMFSSIMNMKDVPTIDFPEANRIGKSLGLDEDSVIDAFFWQKFEDFCEKVSNA